MRRKGVLFFVFRGINLLFFGFFVAAPIEAARLKTATVVGVREENWNLEFSSFFFLLLRLSLASPSPVRTRGAAEKYSLSLLCFFFNLFFSSKTTTPSKKGVSGLSFQMLKFALSFSRLLLLLFRLRRRPGFFVALSGCSCTVNSTLHFVPTPVPMLSLGHGFHQTIVSFSCFSYKMTFSLLNLPTEVTDAIKRRHASQDGLLVLFFFFLCQKL